MKDQSIEQVERALRALREVSQSACAPERVEDSLRLAFRARQSKRRSKYVWVAGAVAASLMIAAAVRLSQPVTVKAPEPAVAAAPPQDQTRPETTATAAAPPVQRVRRSPPPPPANREVVTDFFPIPYAPALTQADRGQVIRVRLPAESMRGFGLPVNEERMFERVRADVLLGEDGIARAIRFVR